ncbi:MAG: GIY-YIG nuclease family protein [Patescibacteria group bacterium]
MYYVYILKSLKDNRTYVGYTHNLSNRMSQHNKGAVITTRHRRPFILVYSESFETQAIAKKKELWWKSGVGRRVMKKFFQGEKFGARLACRRPAPMP